MFLGCYHTYLIMLSQLSDVVYMHFSGWVVGIACQSASAIVLVLPFLLLLIER